MRISHFKSLSWRVALVALGALSQSPPALAQSAPAQTSADIEASKREAEAWAYAMQGGAQIDSNGNVMRNQDGSIMSGATSSEQIRNQQALLQQITGLSGYQTTADPAAKKDTVGATAQVSGYVDFSCTLRPGATKSAAGHNFRFGGCRIKDNTVSDVALQVCSKPLMGATCKESDYTDLQFYPVGYSPLGDGGQIGIGCNEQRVCRVSIVGSFSVTSTGQELQQQAADRNPASEMREIIHGVYESDEYKGAVQEQKDIRDCYANNEVSFLNEGEVQTCDGKQRVAVAGGPSASCTPDRVCVEEVSSPRTFKTSCTRSLGNVTSYSCTIKRRTAQCEDYGDAARWASALNLKNSCADLDLAGATEIARGASYCAYWVNLFGSQWCLVPGAANVSYVWFDDLEYSDCDDPSKLAGPFGPETCDMSSQTQGLLSCEAGGWFGRTLPDDQCIETVTEDGRTYTKLLDARDKPGCGVCANAAKVGFSCLASPTAEDIQGSCATRDLTGCSLTAVEPESREGGILLSQREIYTCTRITRTCNKWQTVSGSCPNVDASYGVDQIPFDEVGDQGAFAQAMAVTGVASEFANAAASGADSSPLLFGGEPISCEKPVGGWLSDALQNDCCKIGLTKTGGGDISNKCKESEVKLASARRNNYAHYIGDRCSKKVGLFNKCVRREEMYCVFDGMLARLVQEQGREQLIEAANSRWSSAKTVPLSFPYYNGNGGWATPITVNGRQVSVYQLPAYCSDTRTAALRMSQDPNATPCPAALGLWFASCNETGTCGVLPQDPEGGSERWALNLIDPLKQTQSALSRYITLKGACDTRTGQCQYSVTALPEGIAGRAVLTQDLSFSLHSMPDGGGTYETAIDGNVTTVQDGAHTVVLGQALIRVSPSGQPAIGEIPATVSAAVSRDNGASWAHFALPTTIPTEVTIPNTTITASGGCERATGQCSYRFTSTVALTPKPWGDVRNPDCSGFTLEQLAALDLSKMDFSEWTSTLETRAPSAAELQALAQQFATQAEDQAGRTNASPTSDPGARVVSVKPSQGIGPFTVRLTVGSKWPVGTMDTIYGGQVDWNDGSPIQSLIPHGSAFYAEHRYQSPEDYGRRETITHTVIVTLHTSSGTKHVALEVRNVF